MSERSLIDLALTNPQEVDQLLPVSFYAGLADRLEEALLAPRKDALLNLLVEIGRLLDVRLERAGPAVRAALSGQGDGGAPQNSIEIAAELGRLSFALLMASQAADRRVPEDFSVLLKAEPYAAYVTALVAGERTNTELRERLGEASETVSRKLRALRDSGVTDFRKEGRRIVNFLTPAAWACLDTESQEGRGVGSEMGTANTVQTEVVNDSFEQARAIAVARLKKRTPAQFMSQPFLGLGPGCNANGR